MKSFLKKKNTSKTKNSLASKGREVFCTLKKIASSFRFWKWDFKTFFWVTAYILRHPRKFYNALSRQSQKWTKRFAIIVAIVLVSIPASFWYGSKNVEAAWWNDSWGYRKAIAVNNSGSTITQQYTKITIDTAALISAGKLKSTCDDIRITDISGALLTHFIDGNSSYACNTATTSIYVLMDSIPASGTTLYLYYGNASAINIEPILGTQQFPGISCKNILQHRSDSRGTSQYYITPTGNSADAIQVNCDMTYSSGGWIQVWHGLPSEAFANDATHETVNLSNNIVFNEMRAEGTNLNFNVVDTVTQTAKLASTIRTYYNQVHLAADGTNPKVAFHTLAGVQSVDLTNNYFMFGYGNVYRVFYTCVNVSSIDYIYLGGYSPTCTPRSSFISTDVGCNGFDNQYCGAPRSTSPKDTGLNLSLYQYQESSIYVRETEITLNTNQSMGSIASEEKSPAPVGYWKFDEGTGTTAQDSTSNNNDGTITGGTWKSGDQCVSGGCLDFIGSGSPSVSVNDNSKLNFGTENFTVSAWALNRDYTYPKSNFMIKKSASCFSDGAANAGFDIGHGYEATDINICLRDVTNNFVRNTVTFDAGYQPSELKNKWTHYEFVFDRVAGRVRIYINGVKQSGELNISAITGSISNSSALTIGTMYGWQTDGKYDEIKLYAYARSADQVKQDYNAGLAGMSTNKGNSVSLGGSSPKWMTDGLAGHWKMDEASWNGTAGEVKDASGNGNNGTAVNGATTGAGKFGNGGNFDGTNDYIDAGNPISLQFAGDTTLSAWINPTSLSDYKFYLSKYSASDLGYDLGVMANGRVATTFRNGTHTDGFSSVGLIQSGVWQHIVVVQKLSDCSVRIYKNGILDSTLTNQQCYSNPSSNLQIGSRGGGNFPGSIDEIRVYNRALSPSEITQLYEYAPSPVVYWNLDEKTGTTINDKSSNSYNGTLGTSSGTPGWGTGKFGSGLNFGSGKYAKVALGSTVNNFDTSVSGRSFSYSLWFNSSSVTTNQFLLTNNEACNNMGNFSLRLSGGNIYFGYYGSGGGATHTVTPLTALQSNQWYHLEWTKTFGQLGVKAYLNGVTQPVTGDSVNLGSGGLNNIVLGAYNGDGITCTTGVDDASPIVSNSFLGSLDDIKIYNYIRTQNQVLDDMNGGNLSNKSPLAYWKFDGNLSNSVSGGSSATTFNAGAASYTNDGKFDRALDFTELYNGNFTYVSSNTFRDVSKSWTTNQLVGYQFATDYGPNSEFCGRTIISNTNTDVVFSGTCSSFSGDKQYRIKKSMYASGPIPNHPTDQITASLWFKSNGSQSARIARMSNEDFNFSIGTSTVSVSAISYSNIISYNTNPHDGKWHYIAIVYDGTVEKIYYDGILRGSGVLTGTLPSDGSLTIGSRNDGNAEFFDGSIDEIKAYSYALSTDEITQDFNQGKSVTMASAGIAAGAGDNSSKAEYCIPGDASACNAPVGQWNFDEGMGTTANDISGNSRTGTLTSGPTWVPGKIGKAINFDGSNDYIGLTRFTLGSGLTFGAWVKTTSADSTAGYAGNAAQNVLGDSTSGINFGFGVHGGKVRYTQYTSGWYNVTGNISVNDGIWHYISATHNQSTGVINIYVDGKFDTTGTIAYSGSIGIDRIGSGYSGDYFTGAIDGVRVYNYVRTPAQIAYDYNRGGPVGWWKMDECQGNTIHDASGNSNNGTLTIGATGTQTTIGTCATASTARGNGAIGKFNSSMSFDGTDDKVSGGSFTLPTMMTISAWIKKTTPTGQKSFFSNRGTGGQVYFGLNGTQVFLFDNAATPSSINSSSGSIQIGQWQHVASVSDGTMIKFYVNGVLIYSTSQSRTSSTGTSFGIGWDPSIGTEYWDGQIDDVRVYNYALTQEQIAGVMNEGSALRFGPATGGQ